eukprot:3292270-Pleurochrysis_carterae.AAC.1
MRAIRSGGRGSGACGGLWRTCDGVCALAPERGGVHAVPLVRWLAYDGVGALAPGRGKARMRWRACALRACD